MRWPGMTFATATALAGCASAPAVPSAIVELMAEAPEDQPTRLLLAGNRIVAAAVALGPGSLPAPVRAAVDRVAPKGETVLQAREWSRRGEGFRIEKHYVIEGTDHVRTALIADDGRILERAFSVPIGEVPEPVLLAALAVGSSVRRAMIVSGPGGEEYWQCVVGDRIGRTYVVRIALDGAPLEVHRRVDARIDI